MIKYGILLIVAVCYMHTASSCTCTREYKPLCGSDGQTYANDCLLRCARARTGRQLTATPGPCRHRREVIRSPCACARNYSPVCANDGNTYANECVLNCAKSKNAVLQMSHPGKCQTEKSCVCTFEFKPVCGSNGQNYSNLCQLNCARKQDPTLRMVHEGNCRVQREEVERDRRSSCICTLEYAPVTGLDGKQYPNRCMAACAGQLRSDDQV